MLAEKILELYKVQEKKREWSNPLRASNSGKCARALAYQLHFPDKMLPLNARARMVFRLGDLVEQDMVDALKRLTIGFKDTQKECGLTISGKEIKGHIDGIVTLGGKDYIMDCKSTSEYGFKEAKKGKIDYGYKCQANFYMYALKVEKFIFLYYNKNTSHITEVVLPFDMDIFEQIYKRFTNVIMSTPEALPDREYGANDKGKLPWNCSYCQAIELCHGNNYDINWDKDMKPIVTLKKEEG